MAENNHSWLIVCLTLLLLRLPNILHVLYEGTALGSQGRPQPKAAK